jgi:hypothetical protein
VDIFSPKNNSHKIVSIVLSGLGLLSLFLLTTSITSLEFKPGGEFTSISNRSTFPFKPDVNNTWWSTLCLSGILVMLPVGLILLIFSPEARKLFRKYMKAIFIWLACVWIVFILSRLKEDNIIFDQSKSAISRPEFVEPPSSTTAEIDVTDIFIPPVLVYWQTYLVGFILVVGVGLTSFYLWERNKKKDSQLEKIVLETLSDINAGRQWEDAVIQCYAQMNDAIRRKHRIKRDISMTPGEFVKGLEEAGLPSGPIRRLTSLFERVRYGNQSSRKNEATEATQCLTEIISSLEVPE